MKKILKIISIIFLLGLFFFAPIIPSTILDRIKPPHYDQCCPLGLSTNLSPLQFILGLITRN